MFGPEKGAGGEQGCAGFEHAVNFAKDLFEVEDMFEGFGREESIDAVVGEGKGFSIVKNIHGRFGIGISAGFDIKTDVAFYMNKFSSIGFGAATQIDQLSVKTGSLFGDGAIQFTAGKVKGIEKEPEPVFGKKSIRFVRIHKTNLLANNDNQIIK